MNKMNYRVYHVWETFLIEAFHKKYRMFLSFEEIRSRIDYILENLLKMSPENLYRNCVFLGSHTIFSSIALDYMHRMITDYQKCIDNPTTCEIDDNPYLSENQIIELQDTIFRYSIIYNDYIETMINCKNGSFEKSYENLQPFYKISNIKKEKPCWISVESDGLKFRCYLGQSEIAYAGVFGTFPHSSISLSSEQMDKIQNLYPERVPFLKAFLKLYPKGIQYPIYE
jgi:hypothetical protein